MVTIVLVIIQSTDILDKFHYTTILLKLVTAIATFTNSNHINVIVEKTRDVIMLIVDVILVEKKDKS